MATYRKNVPLRETGSFYRIADGTMCRMPSPLPGPLRGEPDRLMLGPDSAFGNAFLGYTQWESRGQGLAGNTTAGVGPPQLGRVA